MRPAITSADYTPLPVCRPCQRDECPFPGNEILNFHCITNSENIRIGCTHLLITRMPPQLANLNSGHFCQFGFRFHANSHDHYVGRIYLARFSHHLKSTLIRLSESGHAVAESPLLHRVLSGISLPRLAISGSSGGITWLSFSISVALSPRSIRFSTISRPIKPPPITTRMSLVSKWYQLL